MYVKHIELENVGPIEYLDYALPYTDDKNPKPVIVVGQNGSGKSILLSYIVNSLIAAKQCFYSNSEVEEDKVYKYRSPGYVKIGCDYYFAKIKFEQEYECFEWQLLGTKKRYEEHYGHTPIRREWERLPLEQSSVLQNNFGQTGLAFEPDIKLKELLDKNCILYFPPNRFEEPAWLNLENLTARAEFSDLRHIDGFSNRNVIQLSSFKINKNWLLDLIFDSRAFEHVTREVEITLSNGHKKKITECLGYGGESNSLFESLLEVLGLILRTEEKLRFGIKLRANRKVEIIRNEKPWIPNVFQLSTGELLVLNLFMSILRDYDLTNSVFKDLSQVRGIVLIDEIDLHLHSDMQRDVLPALIKKFPKVQFVVTSHSPLFLLGMEKVFGSDGFDILSLPEGDLISTERFAEFQVAYDYFKETVAFEEDVEEAIRSSKKDLVYVEGETDKKYLLKAAEWLDKNEILDKVEVHAGGGKCHLDNVWKGLKSRLSEAISNKVVLVYDCDTEKKETDEGKFFKRVIPSEEHNPIKKGIENLFSEDTINRVCAENSRFFDRTLPFKRIVRGEEVEEPGNIQINPNEKRNLCDWLCEQGTREDFEGFEVVFTIIKEIVEES